MTHLRLVIVALALASPASAGPLRDTLKYTAFQSAGQLAGDHATSWYYDTRTRACNEDNPLLAKTDGSYATARGWAFNFGTIGGLSTTVYLAKRLHAPRLEKTAKVLMIWGGASGSYFALHNIVQCH